MKKINVFYDATLIAMSYNYKAFRTGLFFVAYNILKQFAKNNRYKITLYVHDCTQAVSNFNDDDLLSQFNVFVDNRDSFKERIRLHKEKIGSTFNIITKFIFFLKIIKNALLLMKSIFSNNQLLKSMHIYFSPFNTAPVHIVQYSNMKHFIILYDTMPINFPEYFPDITDENYWFNKLTKALNPATHYFCISESTKRDYIKYYSRQFDVSKVIVAHIATARGFYPDYDKEKLISILEKYNVKYQKNEKYILSFCTVEPRKNLLFTVGCFMKFIKKHNIDDLCFYLGGLQWDFFVKQLEEKVDGFDEYRNKIIRLGYVDDEDVNILYSNSMFFVYLSQYEGFGMPPLEAMQAGTPVITSNNSSLPEVVGDAAITITYNDEAACIKAFEDMYFDEDLRKKYVEKGIERSKLFTWEKTFDIMSSVIKG